MTFRVFRSYIEKVLIPELDPGSVVILDNLATHNSDTATRMLKPMGSHFLFLPACSPDLNPIDMAFPKLKAHHDLPCSPALRPTHCPLCDCPLCV